MDDIETAVKSIILKVAGLPDKPEKLSDSAYLWELGYNDIMCDDLAEELDKYVIAEKPASGVNSSELSTTITVEVCVSIIKLKLI
ncbi:MAG: hypothetical protein JWR67_2677 [Mucilaginibacter sp.]|nr:hypothetical protein [Mucilaginibacter sp.]